MRSHARRQMPDRIALADYLAAQGKTREEATAILGVTRKTLQDYEVRGGFKFIHAGMSGPRNAERAEKIEQMYRQGITLEKIGQSFGVTRERIRQILKKRGLCGVDGGRRVVSDSKAKARSANVEARSMLKYGLPRAEVAELRQRGLLLAYKNQRNSAHCRGIEWDLSLAQWIQVWRTSGKLDERGRGKGCYVMSRIKDTGGYVVGNVHIQRVEENGREAVAKWRGKRKANRGVFHLYPGNSRPWLASVGGLSGERIGFFATEEEAVAARASYVAERGYQFGADGRVLRKAA